VLRVEYNYDHRRRGRRLGFSDAERYALAAFVAGYRGPTRDAYALDLRQFVAWCTEHHLASSAPGGSTSSASPATSKRVAAL
jgi:hypothetical protein